MPLRANLLLLASALWLAAAAAGVSGAVTQRPFSVRVTEWTRALDQVAQELARPSLSPERGAMLKERLTLVRDKAARAKADALKQLGPAQTRSGALGPPPADDAPPEPEEITGQRKKIAEEIAFYEARIKQADLAIARGNQLEAELGARSLEQAVETLLRRYPLPLAPDTLGGAVPEFLRFLGSLARSPVEWWGDLSPVEREDVVLYQIALVIALAIAIGWALRAALLRWFGPVPGNASPSYGRRLVAAIAEGVALGIVPALILGGFLYRLTSEASLFDGLFAEVLIALSAALIVFVLAWALPRTVLAPDLPAWRLVPFSPEKSRQISHYIGLLAGIVALDIFFDLATRGVLLSDQLTSSYIFLTNSLESVIILALMRGALWRGSEPPSATEPEQEAAGGDVLARAFWPSLRLAVAAAAVASVAASLVGYANVSEYVIRGLLRSGVIVGLLFLGRGLGREGIGAALRTDFMRGGLDLRHTSRNLIKFWVRALFDLTIFAVGLFLILSAWGMPIESLWAWTKNTLTGVTIGGVTLSITDVLAALAVFALTLVVARVLQRALAERVLPQTRLDAGVRHSLAAGVWYLGLIVAVALAIAAMGLDLSNLAIIAGALSVGIGFGLQNVVNNFVSGFILLIERPFKVGDWIVTGANEGFVKRIQLRATEIETFKRASIIVPNSELLSSAIVNWTHKDHYGRVDVAVSAAYGSDVARVMAVLDACLRGHDQILDWPQPQVLFRRFNDSALDFEARGFIANIENIFQVQSALLVAIDQAFREAGIVIPFPQRDLHIKDFDGILAARRGGGEAPERP